MSVDVILGLQWGDEGKGKIVDLLAPKYNIVARFQGGPNAGHTIHFDDKKYVLHTIPSGISSPDTLNIIGNGVLIDPYIFQKEAFMLNSEGVDCYSNLMISRRAHLITPSHRLLDAALEQTRGIQKIGSTLKGIGPAYTDKVARNGLRVGDLMYSDFENRLKNLTTLHFKIIKSLGIEPESLTIEKMSFEKYAQVWFEAIETLRKFRFVDSEIILNTALQNGQHILAEGAQGTMLDVDFGSYPYVTSSNTTIGGVCTGLGIPPAAIHKVYGIFKAYCTRVGSGPFPTELMNEDGDCLRNAGNEFGSTTGRPRRCGWIDLPALRYSIMINGVTDLIITKADVLGCFENIQVCTHYNITDEQIDIIPFALNHSDIKPVYQTFAGWNSDIAQINELAKLPVQFLHYIEFLEKELNKPITVISTGPHRNQTIFKIQTV